MKYLVSAEEMKQYDHNTIEHIGIPGMVLMERAALKAVAILEDEYFEAVNHKKILIVVGVGNNGGDGLAMARLLSKNNSVKIWIVGNREKASQQWKEQRKILEYFPVEISDIFENTEYDIIVDALFGVGLSREIVGICKEAIDLVNSIRGFKMALDIPSGICSDTGRVMGIGFKADVTVTFGFEKRGLYMFPGYEYAGKIIPAEIGIDEHAFMGKEPHMFYYDEKISELMPRRVASGNKGTFGKALLIAGAVNMAGAGILAGKSAYRTGCGMVKLISPALNREIIQSILPDALYGDYSDIENSLEWCDVIGIGPGLSKSEEAKEILKKVIELSDKPIIIDADGINLLSEDYELFQTLCNQASNGRSVIITPHMGELARLVKCSVSELKQDLLDRLIKLAQESSFVIVAKDARTFIVKEGQKICMNIRGNDGMAVAGSGDVLCGIVLSLLAQKLSAFEATCAAVNLHAAIGDFLAQKRGKQYIMASDMAEIPVPL